MCIEDPDPYNHYKLWPCNSDFLINRPDEYKSTFLDECLGHHTLQRDDSRKVVYCDSKMNIKQVNSDKFIVVPTIKRMLSLERSERDQIKKPMRLNVYQLKRFLRKKGKEVQMTADGLKIHDIDLKVEGYEKQLGMYTVTAFIIICLCAALKCLMKYVISSNTIIIKQYFSAGKNCMCKTGT